MPVMEYTMEVTHNIAPDKEKPVLNPYEVTNSMVSSREFTLSIVPHQGKHSVDSAGHSVHYIIKTFAMRGQNILTEDDQKQK